MSIERAVSLFAGLVILTGLGLAYYVSPWWALLSAFAGANLVQSAFTGFCPAAILFERLGMKHGPAFR